MKKRNFRNRVAHLFVASAIVIFSLATIVQNVFAVEYIKNFSNFSAFPYNTSSYKQGSAFVGCGPTTGSMIFAYFDHENGSSLLADPVSGVNEGLATAWALHSWQYMKTNDDGFGSVYDIEPGLELYALDRGYYVKAVVHVSPTYNAGNAPQWLKDYGSYGDSWLNDGNFWYQHGDGSWDINANDFCDFVHNQISAGVTVFLTVDSDGNGGGDHWVPLVGIDKSAGRYYFYDTYSTSLKSAQIRYCGAVSQNNSISFVRTVSYEGPVQQDTPPTNLLALNNYRNAIPLAWKKPASLRSSGGNSHSILKQQTDFQQQSRGNSISFPFEAEERFMQKTTRDASSSPLMPTGYNIYRSTSSNGTYTKISSNVSRQYFRDTNVAAGQIYYYKVTAVYSGSESDFSNKANAAAASDGYFIDSGWTNSVPTIDGHINSSEWSNAETVDILYPGKTGAVTMYVMNNGSKLFLAVDDERDTHVDDLDQFAVFFDKNLDREFPASAPSDEGNFWIAWDAASASSFTLFGPRYGYWPDHLGWEELVTPAGVEHSMSSASGHIQYEGSFDLASSPLAVSPDGTFGMLVFTYDYNFTDFNGFWPQESDRLREITLDISSSGQAPFSYGDVHLATSGPTPPLAPSNLVATAISNSKIDLVWQDNSDDESGFKVERKKGASGSWILLGWTSQTTWHDVGLDAGTTYYYRVYAYRGSVNSDYSNIAQATTFSSGNSVTVTAPNVEGFPGDTIDVPISVNDLTGKGVISFALTVECSNSVLTPLGAATDGTIIDGWGNIISNVNGSEILVSGAGTSFISGSGYLVILKYLVSPAATSGQTSPLHFVNVMFNEGDPSSVNTDGLFTVSSGYDVSGSIKYYQNLHPIADVELALGGETSQAAADGAFAFAKIPAGNYDLIPTKNGDLGSSISAFDASMVLRYSVGLVTLQPYQLIAADVSGNGSVSAYDASYILRYTVGLVTSFPVGDEWKFVPVSFGIDATNWGSAPDNISFSPLNANMTDQDFYGIIYGDVSGNWSPMEFGKAIAGKAVFNFGDLKSSEAGQIQIPVAADIAGEMYSAKIDFYFNSALLKFKGLSLSDQLKDFNVAQHLERGNLQIALAGKKSLNSETELFTLQFERVNVKNSSPAALELVDAHVNEGKIAVEIPEREISLNPDLPKTIRLQQNYPNPFNPTTTIEYSLSSPATVMLTIFDVNGVQVRQLVSGTESAGQHLVQWDARDNSGKSVSSGIYFYRIRVKAKNGNGSSFVSVKKMMLMK